MKVFSLQWLAGLAIVFIFFVDQIIKFFLVKQMQPFRHAYVFNERLAFGLPWPTALIFVAVFLIMTWLLKEMYLAWKINHSYIMIAIASVFFGAVSNVGDRILYGGVIDYLEVVSWYPVFNLADVLIFGGLVVWFWLIVREKLYAA